MGDATLTAGTVYQYRTKTGKKFWRYQVTKKSEDGSCLERLSKGGFRTKADASLALAQLRLSSRASHRATQIAEHPLFEEFARKWLGGLSHLQPSTVQGYEKNLRNHLIPTLGGMPLDTISPEIVSALFKRLQTSGRVDSKDFSGPLGPNTIHKIATALSLIFKRALEEGEIQTSPMNNLRLPSIVQADEVLHVWTMEQCQKFLAWNASVDQDDLHCLWRLMLFTGLRRGEALALQWGDVIPLPSPALRVLRATDPTRRGATKAPKTKKSRRRVELDEETLNSLQTYKHERELLNLKFVLDEAWVFGGKDGQLRSPNDVTARWTRAVERARNALGPKNLPRVTLKGLRHTHATLLLEIGTNAKIVQERYGHSTYNVTMDVYSHVTQTMQSDAVAKLASRFNEIAHP